MEILGFGSFIYGNPYRRAFIREADALLAKRLERLEGAIGATTQPAETRDQLLRLRRQVVELRKALEANNQPVRLSRTFLFGSAPIAATATSAINLNLGATIPLTAATLESMEEVNTTATSFTPFGPNFTGASTTEATIGGIYDGSNGTATLTFRVTKGGTHGVSNIHVRVYDPAEVEIDFFNVKSNDPINMVYTLANGLTFTLGAGDAIQNDEFTIQVFDSVGSAVDPDKPFDGIRNQNPNFENGLSVTAGSFDVNGETITVLATDTINSILGKITSSNAGVTATFNSQTEKIMLTQNTLGSSPTIVLDNDSSGFLAATKLAAATVVPGTDRQIGSDDILSSIPQFASVINGSILINGESIAIDVGSDSLNDVLANINASAAGVTASLINGGQKISIVATSLTGQIILNGNGTGFFTASEITETTYNPTEGQLHRVTRKGLTDRRSQQLTRSLREVANTLNPIFDEAKSAGSLGASLIQLRANLKGAIVGSSGSKLDTDFGINFDFGMRTNTVFAFSRANQDQLTASLRRKPDAAHTLLFADNGLISRLLAVIQQAEQELNAALGLSGTFVDVFA